MTTSSSSSSPLQQLQQEEEQHDGYDTLRKRTTSQSQPHNDDDDVYDDTTTIDDDAGNVNTSCNNGSSGSSSTPEEVYFYKTRNSLIDFDQLLPPVEVDMDALGSLLRSLRQYAAVYSRNMRMATSGNTATADADASTATTASSTGGDVNNNRRRSGGIGSIGGMSVKEAVVELMHKIQMQHAAASSTANGNVNTGAKEVESKRMNGDAGDAGGSGDNDGKSSLGVKRDGQRTRVVVRQYEELPNMEGFFNLALVLLGGAVLALMAENMVERGFLINLSLLQCMMGDWWLGALMVLNIYFVSILCYGISLIGMKLVRPVETLSSLSDRRQQQEKQQKRRLKPQNQKPSSKLQILLYWFSISLYITCQGFMLFIVCRIIFKRRVSLLVSMLTTLVMMIYSMKMHSYFAYIAKEYSPSFIYQNHKIHSREKDVSLEEYLYFLVAPTLCFFRYYPRSKKIRLFYILEHALMGLVCVAGSYMIFMQYLDPIFQEASDNRNAIGAVIYGVIKASVPWFIVWLLASFSLFHCYLNIVAEITFFGDRLWYKDWWNADSFDMFWRKWNIPVHHWLLKHVYFESIRMQFSRLFSVMVTFLLSGVLHEAVMAIMFRNLKMYFLSAMLVQVPAVMAGKLLQRRGKSPAIDRVSNMLTWLSLFTGQPLLLLLYFRSWYAEEGGMCIMS